MCGFLVVVSSKKFRHDEWDMLARKELARRGPDGFGSHRSSVLSNGETYYVSMFHSRLSIVGGAEGNQPLVRDGGSLVFNGEFYDFKSFGLDSSKATSDTVELAKIIESEKVSNIYQKDWMGCFFHIDTESKKVVIGRCTTGQKPLYYYSTGEVFLVGSSEFLVIRALEKLYGKPPKVNLELVKCLVDRKRLQDPFQGLFCDIKKWPANTILKLNIAELFEADKLSGLVEGEFVARWREVASLADNKLSSQDIHQFVAEGFSSVSSIDKSIIGGIFLSGGVDSAILASLASCESSYTNYYSYANGTKNSEIEDARQTARHFDISNLREVSPTSFLSFQELLDEIKYLIDEAGCLPHSFSSICFSRLCKAASADGCKVILTGQGADELFMGYRKYSFLSLITRNISLRTRLTAFFSAILSAVDVMLSGDTSWRRYLRFNNGRSSMSNSHLLSEMEVERLGPAGKQRVKDFIWDSLPDIFSYEDNIGLSCGLEVRVPFLSSKCVKPAFSAPSGSLFNKHGPKGALKQAFWGKLPDHLKHRKKKKGFVNEWPEYLHGWHQEIFSFIGPTSSGIASNLWSEKELVKLQKAVIKSKGKKYSDNVFKYIVLECFLQKFGSA